MNNEDTTNGKILIAKFMEGKQLPTFREIEYFEMPFTRTKWTNTTGGSYEETNEFSIFDLHYDTSWDWLMPVCKKIIEMYFDERSDIFSGLTTCDIEKTFSAVVKFIEFWNDESKPKIKFNKK